MRFRRFMFAALACCVFVTPDAALGGARSPASFHASTNATTAVLQRQLDALVRAGVPGVVLLVKDGPRWVRLAAGTSDIAVATPMRVRDRFKIGSVTKTFVATVVLQLAGEGRLRLDAPIGRWLPHVVPDAADITVRELLRHQSGLFDYFQDPRSTAPYLAGNFGYVWKPRALVRIATSHPPLFPPGSSFSYSNTNYFVLGLLVERVTGHSLRRELRARIFRPLRLHATRFPTSQRFGPRLAHGYLWTNGTRQDVSRVSQSLAWAAGGVVSSAGDVARFYRGLLRGRLISRALLRQMEQTVPLAPGVGYGLGIISAETPCGTLWGHDGSFAGYLTDALSSPSGRHQMVLLMNQNTFDDLPGSPAAQQAAGRLIQTAACARLGPAQP
jgi:D-alanyl-D-alanine carboxypeptidase